MTEAVIVGIGDTDIVRHSDKPDEVLQAEAIRLALDDAGLSKQDVDGLAVCTISVPDDTPHIAEHFGWGVNWLERLDFGGGSAVASLARARMAIEAGAAEVVVAVAGGNRLDRPQVQHDVNKAPLDYGLRNWMIPFGYAEPNGFFGMIQRRHMEEFGTTLEQLGKIATTFRSHAQMNDRAVLRDPMSLEDYLGSRLIADPIRFYDCVMRCSGAAAVVMVNSRIAIDLDVIPIYMGEYGERISHQASDGLPDRLAMGFESFRDELFRSVRREDLDFAQLYDDYPIAVLMTLESLGFAKRGEGGTFIEERDLSFSGDLPLNTGGGQLSMGQPSLAGGSLHILEAVRQLRGEAGDRQVPDARTGLVSGIGMLAYLGNLAVANAIILSKESLR